MKNISTFVIAFLIIGFFFATFIDNVNAGIGDMPTEIPPACSVLVEKVEIPDTGKDFGFDLTGDVNDNFGLTNGESIVLEFGENQDSMLIENIPVGYNLNIECTQGVEDCPEFGVSEPCLRITTLEDGNGVTIECDDSATNDMGSCTFTNTLTPRNVPTLSEWGLVAMAGILGIVGFMLIRRKKASA